MGLLRKFIFIPDTRVIEVQFVEGERKSFQVSCFGEKGSVHDPLWNRRTASMTKNDSLIAFDVVVLFTRFTLKIHVVHYTRS